MNTKTLLCLSAGIAMLAIPVVTNANPDGPIGSIIITASALNQTSDTVIESGHKWPGDSTGWQAGGSLLLPVADFVTLGFRMEHRRSNVQFAGDATWAAQDTESRGTSLGMVVRFYIPFTEKARAGLK